MAQHRILLVDDQKEVRSMLRSGLETLRAPVQVVDVPSAEEALLVLSRQPVSLLITDVRLAGITGLELLAKVRARSPQVKVILMTGMTDERTRRQVSEARAEAWFFKPVPMASFLEAVERCLDKPLEPQPVLSYHSQGRAQKTVGNCLAELRQETGALYAALLDQEGRMVGQCGELGGRTNPEDFEAALAGSLAAGSRLAFMIESAFTASPHTEWFPRAFSFMAGAYRVWSAPVGERLALVLVSREGPASGNDHLSEAANRAARELTERAELAKRGGETTLPREANEKAGLPVPALRPAGGEAPGEEVALPDENLASILQGAAFIQMESQDVAVFWEMAAEESGPGFPAEGLSFEQARQLGLTPDE
jgi:CheY-like chemotaxis protein